MPAPLWPFPQGQWAPLLFPVSTPFTCFPSSQTIPGKGWKSPSPSCHKADVPHLLDDPWLMQSQGGEMACQWSPALAVVGSPGTVVAGCLRSGGCPLPLRAEPDSVMTRLAGRARTSFLRLPGT